MKASIRFAPVCFALAGVLLIGCQRGNDQRDPSSADIAAEIQANGSAGGSGSHSTVDGTNGSQGETSLALASEAAVASGFNETVDSMSDTNVSDNNSQSLSSNVDLQFNINRNCAAADGKAVVTLGIDKQASWERSNARIQASASSTIETQIVRTWSKDGATVGCTLNGKFAAVDFEADLTGYQLDVTVDRAADRSVERTEVKTGAKTTVELKSSVKGLRHAEWISQSNEIDGTLSRSKIISFKVDRSDSVIGKDGLVKDLQLSVETTEDLKVTVNWDTQARHRQLLSKLIASGKIKASHASDGHIEASFKDILMKFDANSCVFYSGSMEAKVYAEGSSTAAKTYLLVAASGSITVQDVSDPAHPKDVDDFDYSPCDVKDFNY